MRWLLRSVVLVVIHGCGASARAPSSPVSCPPACPTRDGAAAVKVIHDLYAAFRIDDAAAAGRLFAPEFGAIDGGQRFSGPELMGFVKKSHDDGKQFVWKLDPPEIHVACDVAWLRWENRGSITDASGTIDIVWNESAVLRWIDDGWRLVLFHSSRAKA